MRALRIAAASVVVALLGLLVWDVAHSHGGKVAKDVDEGEVVAAPQFALPLTTGNGKLSLASLRGKTVVLNFWASDCVPCVEEQKTLNKTAAEWSKKGVVFLGIDEIDVNGPARKYLEKHDVTYQSVSDGDGAIAGKYGVTGTPETFFIDPQGKVVPPHIVAQASPTALEAGIRRALGA